MKALKILLSLVLLVVLAAVAGLAYLYLAFPKVGPAEAVTVDATPERVARGEYLANHVTGCVECHARRDFTRFAGPRIEGTAGEGGDYFGEPGSPLELYSPNITPARIGDWTDGELLRAFTEGVSRDGTPLFPIMPYPRYARLAREDAEAIVAYIRTLPPSDYTPPPSHLGFPLPLVKRTIPAPAAFRPIPPKSDRVAYGEYLTNAAVCADCHTTMDDQGQALPGMDFAGGNEFYMEGGGRVRTANITPDADTGIGTWSETDFVQKFKGFLAPPPRVLTEAERRENTIMPWYAYAGMTEEDLGAIYTYLRTITPVVNRVDTHPK
ncbi:MAG: cytochrome c [Vicinamibacterales bacterium]